MDAPRFLKATKRIPRAATVCLSEQIIVAAPVRRRDNVGLDLPVGVDRCSAVTPLATDLDVLVKLGASDFLAFA